MGRMVTLETFVKNQTADNEEVQKHVQKLEEKVRATKELEDAKRRLDRLEKKMDRKRKRVVGYDGEEEEKGPEEGRGKRRVLEGLRSISGYAGTAVAFGMVVYGLQ